MYTLTKEERCSVCDLYTESFWLVLESVVKEHILEPAKLGAKFCNFDIMLNANSILSRKKDVPLPEQITWEERYRVEYTIRQLVCFRFLFHFGLTEKEQDDFRSFIERQADTFDDYYQAVCNGFNDELKRQIEKYPVLKVCYSVVGKQNSQESSDQ